MLGLFGNQKLEEGNMVKTFVFEIHIQLEGIRFYLD